MSIVIFFVILFVLVLVHEWGHFIVAKKTGMRVDEFGIGFSPKLFSYRKGETEYSFNALPIGGFVRIYGEDGVQSDSVSGELNQNETSSSKDASRAFSARPKWAQALVLIAGVTMNVLLAWLLFTIVLIIGVPTAVTESAATEAANLYVAEVLPDSPAETVLPVGAMIVSISANGETLIDPTPSSFSQFIQDESPAAFTIEYSANDKTINEVTITPEQGLLEDSQETYVAGVSLTLIETVSRPWHIAIRDGLTSTMDGLVAITVGLYTLLSDAVVGEGDFSTVAGPVGIVGLVDDATAFGVTAVLSFTALISLNLAIINLLPFPALDGGRLLFVFIEAVTGKDIPPQWSGILNTIGFILLMLLMIAVTYNDILRLL